MNTNRISDKVFRELNSLDDLIIKMGTTKEGHKVNGIGEPNEFKQRLEMFRKFLKTKLPEFTEEELLKIDMYFFNLRDIYEWHNVHNLFTALEYEHRINK